MKNSYYYDPYGNSLNKNETVSNPWQYASGYYDATTGLYKFGTRYYDPQTGRWTQKDPKPSGNPYVYAGDEPTMQVDPSGRDSCFDAIKNAVIGVVVADLVAIGAFIGYAYAVSQVNVAATALEVAIQ